MKIYIITGEPFPNGMAATNRIKCYASAIHEGGLECEVVVYRRTEVYGCPVRNTVASGKYEDVPYRYIAGTTLRHKNLLIRQVLDRLDIWRTWSYLKRNMKTGDVLFLYMGGNVDLMLRFMNVAHGNGAYCVRDLCELPYGTGAETQTAIRMRKKTLERQFPKLDGIISISDSLLNLAKTYSLPSCKHMKVPIMVDFEKYAMEDRSSEVQIPYIFHSGTLYEQKDGILGMITAIGEAVAKATMPFKFICTGNIDNSPHVEDIRQLIDYYHLKDKIIFTGYLSEEELRDYLSKASLVIINKYKTQQNQYCFSTKLGEYLAAEKPLIITSVGEAMNWLTDKKNAYIIEPENTTALTEAILYMLQNRKEAKMLGSAGKKMCQESFDYHVWGKPLADFMKGFSK